MSENPSPEQAGLSDTPPAAEQNGAAASPPAPEPDRPIIPDPDPTEGAESPFTEGVEFELRGRVTTLEESHNRLVSAVRFIALALLSLTGGALLLLLLVRKALTP